MTGMRFLNFGSWMLRLVGAVVYGAALIAVLRVAWTLLKTSLTTLIAPLGLDLQSLSGLLSLFG